MKKILMFILPLLLWASAGAQITVIDSVTIPVLESWDDSCQCYTQEFVLYVVADTTAADDTLLWQFGYRHLDTLLWTTSFYFVDSAGASVSIRAAIIDNRVFYDRYDVSRDGELSILDIVLLIRRLFYEPY